MDDLEDLSRRAGRPAQRADPMHARPQAWLAGGGTWIALLVLALIAIMLLVRVGSVPGINASVVDKWSDRMSFQLPRLHVRRLPDALPLPSGATPAKGIGEEGWITPDDYPSTSIRRNQSGVVVIRWRVADDGSIDRCGTVRSSGHQRLDRAACRAIRRRARYQPARDAAGRPIASTVTRTVRWVLPPQ